MLKHDTHHQGSSSGQNSYSVRELDNPALHSLLLPCRLVRENQRLGCWHGIWVWAYELPRWSHRPGCRIREDLSPHVRDQGEPPRWRTSAVVWHGEGWAPPCDIAQDTPHVNDNHNSIHTGSVVARNKDRAFRCWPSGRRWKVCDWWTKIATCQKQHHYRHLEREITESSRKSWRTNTWNEEIPMEHPWTLWSTLEKLWWNIYSRRPQAIFQWPWRQTWAWSWIPHSQRHCECHHGMPTSLQPTHYHSSEGITI